MATSDKQTETPSFAKTIRDAIDARLLDLHTAMPAQIESYDATTMTAKVQPLLKRKYVTGDLVDLPVISDVPVLWPRAGQAFLHFPLTSADTVMLLFSERSLERWKLLGGKTDPRNPRKFSLSDAVAIPGMYPKINPAIGASSSKVTLQINALTKLEFDDTSIYLKTATMELKLNATGKFSVTNPLGEFTAALSQLFTDIGSAQVATALGLQPLIMPTFILDKLIFDSFKA